MEFVILEYSCGCKYRVWQNGELGSAFACEYHMNKIKTMKPYTEDEQRRAKGVC